MIPVTQDIFINDPQGRVGNCLVAAIASILELPLVDVPHFVSDYEDWYENMVEWLGGKGFDASVCLEEECENFYLAIGPSPRGASHAVVYHNGQLAHDPHPSRDGILEVKWCVNIKPKQPSP